jgi:hypothetical protein
MARGKPIAVDSQLSTTWRTPQAWSSPIIARGMAGDMPPGWSRCANTWCKMATQVRERALHLLIRHVLRPAALSAPRGAVVPPPPNRPRLSSASHLSSPHAPTPCSRHRHRRPRLRLLRRAPPRLLLPAPRHPGHRRQAARRLHRRPARLAGGLRRRGLRPPRGAPPPGGRLAAGSGRGAGGVGRGAARLRRRRAGQDTLRGGHEFFLGFHLLRVRQCCWSGVPPDDLADRGRELRAACRRAPRWASPQGRAWRCSCTAGSPRARNGACTPAACPRGGCAW